MVKFLPRSITRNSCCKIAAKKLILVIVYRVIMVAAKYTIDPENSVRMILVLLSLHDSLVLLIELDNSVDKKANGSSP